VVEVVGYLCIILAAALNAVMDILENENFHTSIFKGLPESFWYKRESWKTAPRILGYRVDAWHLAKSLMAICLIGGIIFHDTILPWYGDMAALGLTWNMTFTLFYHKFLRA
jgi:hypothetical protein